MRSLFLAIGLVVVGAATSAAQLLGDPAGKPDDAPANKPVPGRPAADAKRGAGVDRPGDVAAAAPRANAMFAAMDADGDGVISKSELRKAIKALRTLDADSDGSITLAEASVGGAATVPGGAVAEDPQVAQLMAMDSNNDNKLTANEVPRNMQATLGAADQNGDGEITRQEITAAMANARNQFGAGPWPAGAGGPRGLNGGGLNNADQAMGRFLQYDKDGDGQLSEGELPPQAKRMMQADKNKDGQLDAGEMQAALAQMGDRARGLRGGVDPGAPRGRGGVDRDRKRPGDVN